MPSRFSDGTSTVTLDDGLDRFIRSALSAAEKEVVGHLEAAAEAVAADARGKWYQQVERRTGKSGDIVVFTTFDTGKGEVRVTVGSTDIRKQGSTPVAVLVHRPGPLSQVSKKGVQGRVTNPLVSDGRALMLELVRKPVRATVRSLGPALGRAIASRMQEGA